MFNNAQIRKYAGVEVCTALTKADHWSGGDVKAPHLNDAPEPWIGLYSACRNVTQHLIDFYADCVVIG
jgi:hypothetical protein